MPIPVFQTIKSIVAAIFVVASLVGLRAAAQIHNPIQTAKDAYRKARLHAGHAGLQTVPAL